MKSGDTLTAVFDRRNTAALEQGIPPVPMHDVSKFKTGDACPRCSGRRVYAVDADKNLWLCVASALPVPWRRDQTREHEATQDPQVNE